MKKATLAILAAALLGGCSASHPTVLEPSYVLAPDRPAIPASLTACFVPDSLLREGDDGKAAAKLYRGSLVTCSKKLRAVIRLYDETR